jgi:ABC-type sugar transport system substrate-binding protein
MGQFTAQRTFGALAALGVCAALGACGSGGGSSGTAAAQKGSGSLNGGGKEIVLFGQTSATPYIGFFNTAAKAEAKRLGYKLRIIETPDVDQTTQDGLVRQFLASGDKPAAIVWWPANSKASVNSVRLLSRVAPVFQTNVNVLPPSRPYVTAYTGSNDVKVGENAGEMMMQLRDKVKAAGVKLHDPRGNVVILNFPAGYQGGIDRSAGFRKATAAQPFNIIHEEWSNYYAPQPAYQNATQLIPKYKDKVDFVFVMTTGAATGAMKALRENGLTPGKNVFVVAGNCAGGDSELRKGEVYGATLQSPLAEGRLAMGTIASYLATGKVRPGSQSYPATPTPPAVKATPPFQNNYMPLPKVTSKAEFDAANVFGASGKEICR